MKDDNDIKEKMSYGEFLETPYKFPYENYEIIGDVIEIDKIANTCGVLNLEIDDIFSTLSKDTVNYVVVGLSEGDDCISYAFNDAMGKLPIDVDRIARMLFNIWIPMDMPSSVQFLNSLTMFIKALPRDMYWCYGLTLDESLGGQQVKVTLIAASK
ncbi:MAG: hypothetical protein K2L46_05940 [Paramuribaculum sp.]|nr:hypothetical protein [Paramuribaculum sp.]MDE6488805.1 hypothetical protein [Paramuribaculum sp.]